MIDKSEILRYLKCKTADDVTDSYITECCDFLTEKCRPKYVYKCFDADTSGNKTVIGGSVEFLGDDIKKHLSGSEKCVLMAATVGIEADREIKRLSVLSVAKAVVLDACATAYIEEICDSVQSEIERKLGSVNYRYSPGYGDFPLEAQSDFINMLDTPRKIGLTLSGGGMLIPTKSVTAVLGIVKNNSNCAGTKCERCPNRARCEYSNENQF